MKSGLGRSWWMVAMRGILAVAFGLYALFVPGLALAAIIMAFGVVVLLAGILAIVAGMRRQAEHQPSWPFVIEGIICVALGLLALIKPGATAVAWLYLISGFAVVSGILHIVAGVELRKQVEGEWVLILNGILTTILGILMVLLPWAGLLSLVWLIGAYSLFFGVLLLVFAFRLRSIFHASPAPRPARR
jgi:uncharacterized membrane protein HdeD (DUF308 family)